MVVFMAKSTLDDCSDLANTLSEGRSFEMGLQAPRNCVVPKGLQGLQLPRGLRQSEAIECRIRSSQSMMFKTLVFITPISANLYGES